MFRKALTPLRKVSFVLPGVLCLACLSAPKSQEGRKRVMRGGGLQSAWAGARPWPPETVFTNNRSYSILRVAGGPGQEEAGRQGSGEIYRNRVMEQQRTKEPAGRANERRRLEKQGKTKPKSAWAETDKIVTLSSSV